LRSRYFDRAERPQIERELAADARTHEGLLRERRIEELEQRRVSYKRNLHAAIGCAILKYGGEARYKDIRREARIRDKQLSKALKELKAKGKITSRVDNAQRPPAVYYKLTKKGYEDRRLQREWFANVEMMSVIERSLEEPVDVDVARKMLRLTFLTVLFIVKIMAKDYAKRIESNEFPILRVDEDEVPITFHELVKNPWVKDLLHRKGIDVKWPCGYTPDFTDYTDIEEIIVPRLIDALAVAIDSYLAVRFIKKEMVEEMVAQRLKALSQAIGENLKSEDEVKIMDEFHDWWHGEKDLAKTSTSPRRHECVSADEVDIAEVGRMVSAVSGLEKILREFMET